MNLVELKKNELSLVNGGSFASDLGYAAGYTWGLIVASFEDAMVIIAEKL